MSFPGYKILKTPYIFRYISDNELNFIKRHHAIYSYNPLGTYWTTLLTDDPNYAQRMLFLKSPPKYRVGGILLRDVDPNYIIYKGIVAPAHGNPGGAEEILIATPIPIISIFDMNNKITLYSYLKQL